MSLVVVYVKQVLGSNYLLVLNLARIWYCFTEGSFGEELSTTMLLLGIWAQKGSAGQKVLEALGINDDKITELAATVSISFW